MMLLQFCIILTPRPAAPLRPLRMLECQITRYLPRVGAAVSGFGRPGVTAWLGTGRTSLGRSQHIPDPRIGTMRGGRHRREDGRTGVPGYSNMAARKLF